jgi:aryl-alcohol dehydrogenase-like predicted oxidoreductase
MRMRAIPGIGLQASAVALGTMTFGNPVGAEKAIELVRYAISRGIGIIDTANMYEGYNRVAGSAGGVAESILGLALEGVRDKVIVATKIGMKVGSEPEDDGTSAAAIRRQLQASLKRLRTGHVDIYYLHRPDAPELLEGTLRELARCIKEKAIRCYGVSNYSEAQLRELLDVAEAIGAPAPAVCQPPLSLLKREALDGILPLCAQRGIAAIPYQIYQGGLLAGKYRRNTPPPQGSRAEEKPAWLPDLSGELYDQLEKLESEAKWNGLTLQQYALRWVLEQEPVVSAIIGVKSREQIDAAVDAANLLH